jgi:hypothetical protein
MSLTVDTLQLHAVSQHGDRENLNGNQKENKRNK